MTQQKDASDGDLFITVADIRNYSFTKKILQCRGFLVNFGKFADLDFFFCRRLKGNCF